MIGTIRDTLVGMRAESPDNLFFVLFRPDRTEAFIQSLTPETLHERIVLLGEFVRRPNHQALQPVQVMETLCYSYYPKLGEDEDASLWIATCAAGIMQTTHGHIHQHMALITEADDYRLGGDSELERFLLEVESSIMGREHRLASPEAVAFHATKAVLGDDGAGSRLQ